MSELTHHTGLDINLYDHDDFAHSDASTCHHTILSTFCLVRSIATLDALKCDYTEKDYSHSLQTGTCLS